MWRPEHRPALVARWPLPTREALSQAGIAVRTMTLHREGTQLRLPSIEGPLLCDLRGLTLTGTAQLLCTLQAQQHCRTTMPYLLVPQHAIGIQRLIAGCHGLHAIILEADDSESLVTWLIAPIDPAYGQIWVNLYSPTPLSRRSYLTPIVAALGRATSITEAAQRCAMAPNTFYACMHECCGIADGALRHRSLSRWRTLLSLALVGHQYVAVLANQRWRYRPYDHLSRQLVGGVIVRMVADHELAMVVCQVPDTQHALLAIELRGGRIAGTEEPVGALPAWARVIEWVDSFPESTLAIGLVGGSVLRLCGDRLVTRWVRWMEGEAKSICYGSPR